MGITTTQRYSNEAVVNFTRQASYTSSREQGMYSGLMCASDHAWGIHLRIANAAFQVRRLTIPSVHHCCLQNLTQEGAAEGERDRALIIPGGGREGEERAGGGGGG